MPDRQRRRERECETAAQTLRSKKEEGEEAFRGRADVHTAACGVSRARADG